MAQAYGVHLPAVPGGRSNMTSGIYMLKNIVNNKVYIGQSWDIPKRFYDHERHLRKNNHYNGHLQKSWNKYGKESFEFSVLWNGDGYSEMDQEILDSAEILFIDLYNAVNKSYGYCAKYGGLGGKLTEDAKKKIGDFHRGKTISEEHKEANRKFMIGKKFGPHKEETKRKISESNKGKKKSSHKIPRSEEHRLKLSAALRGKPSSNKGKPMCQAAKDKLSVLYKGITRSQEFKEALSKAKLGKPWTQARRDAYNRSKGLII